MPHPTFLLHKLLIAYCQEKTKQAMRKLGFSDEVLHIGDNLEIAKYGFLSTPALIIESKAVSSGQFLRVEDIKGLIEKADIKA